MDYGRWTMDDGRLADIPRRFRARLLRARHDHRLPRRFQRGVDLRQVRVEHALVAREVDLKLRLEDGVHIVGLLRRTALAVLDEAEQACHLVVDADREVERVLTALILRL